MRLTTTVLIFFLPCFLCSSAGAEMLPVRKVRAGIPPYSVAENMVRHNDAAVARAVADLGQEKMAPTPHLVWLADCDARLQPSLFYPEPEARIYSVRNLANQLALSLGAVDYGITELLAPVLLITGNTDSDSLRLLGRGKQLAPELRGELDRLPLTAKQAGQAGVGKDAPAVEANVDYQVAEAVKRYQGRIASGRLVVIGAVFDLDNQYGLGANRLLIININGETEAERLRAMSHLTRLDKRLLDLVGRRAPRQEAAEMPTDAEPTLTPLPSKKKK